MVLSLTHIEITSACSEAAWPWRLFQPFVMVLKSRGLAPWRILFQHVLRNALIPFVTYLGVSVP
jgi:peptide/nickel transport system permease protein